MTPHHQPTSSSAGHPDWESICRSEPFTELVARRSRFIWTAALALLGWFAAFLAVVGVAPGLSGTVVVAGMSVGFLLGLSQFVLAWLLTWRYLRLSSSVFTDLEDRVRGLAAPTAPTAEGATP